MAGESKILRAAEAGWCRTEADGAAARLLLGGDWTVAEAGPLDRVLQALELGAAQDVTIDGRAIARLDTVGVWLLLRTKRRLEAEGRRVAELRLPPDARPLVETIDRSHTAPPVVLPRRYSLAGFVEQVGRATVEALDQGYAMVNFLGLVSVETVATILRPRRLRLAALAHQIEETGVTALPILGLLAFLLGVVIAYQGADQLRRFGAEIFTVNLLAVSLLREIGGLIAAIIVAGRSGSAFTAQIGTMRVNEEVDALQTLGLNVVEVLVLPRILALVITLPLLTFYANMMGLIGGAVMSYFDLGITVPVFLRQFQGAITPMTFSLGLIKAPVFAFIIALVGCFEGLRVERNAASVGRLTTQSVVESIFLVIVFDAMFSILFSILGI